MEAPKTHIGGGPWRGGNRKINCFILFLSNTIFGHLQSILYMDLMYKTWIKFNEVIFDHVVTAPASNPVIAAALGPHSSCPIAAALGPESVLT